MGIGAGPRSMPEDGGGPSLPLDPDAGMGMGLGMGFMAGGGIPLGGIPLDADMLLGMGMGLLAEGPFLACPGGVGFFFLRMPIAITRATIFGCFAAIAVSPFRTTRERRRHRSCPTTASEKCSSS